MSELFRREAVSHSARRLSGEVLLAIPLSRHLLMAIPVVVVALGVLFAATATYARRETVPGWLTPRDGLIRVAVRTGGELETLLVREEQQVSAGQALAVFRLSSDAGQGDVGAALARGLASEATAMDARGEAERARLLAEGRRLRERRAALTRELEQVSKRIGLQDEQVRLAEAEVVRAEQIATQGFLPRREVESRRSAALAAEDRLAALRSASLSIEREIGEVDAELRVLPAALEKANADIAAARARLTQRLTQAEARSTYVATAPVAGRVAALPVAPGQTLPSGAVVAVLTPRGSALEAELYVPSRAAGFIRPGQDVRLMYQAFPHQKFGTGRGVVTSISSTALAPDEVAIPGVRLTEPVFRLRARLDRATVAAYGRTIKLQPGMMLTADVIIDRRTLIEWLLDPLYAAGRRG